MIDNHEKSAWSVLLLVVIASGVGILMGTAIGAGVASLFYSGEGSFLEHMTNPTDDRLRVPLLVVQGITTLCGFLIAPYFVWVAMRKKKLTSFNTKKLQPFALLLVFGIVVAFAVADSAIIEWNENIQFPDFLSSFEKWARAKEDQLAELTKMLTQFQSFSEFALAFLVVAIFAGICEEFLFRGIIQTELLKATKNIHAAIWISAFFFSAIHVQFFGFVPRMLLGALFGYLYYWSGNLWVPMFAHFVNNGFAVCMIYLYQKKIVDTNLDSPEAAPWPAVIAAAGIVVAALWYFKTRFQSSNPSLT
jgi:membrane protease YdiL (CAAX protease family)